MARPQKFRIPPEQVTEPDNARKVAGHVAEIEFFRAQVEKIQTQIAGIYDAADEEGFDKKFIRKLVARRAKDSNEIEAEEYGLECYAMAVAKGMPTRTREENPDHDPETGEIIESNQLAADDLQATPGGPNGGEGNAPALSAEPITQPSTVSLGSVVSGGEEANPVLVADTIKSGEAHQEGVAVGESPMPDPADGSGISGGGENVAAPGSNSHSGTGEAAQPASSVVAFKPKPHNGPVDKQGIPRPLGCKSPDMCGSSNWRHRCHGCETAFNAAKGVEIPHQGSVA